MLSEKIQKSVPHAKNVKKIRFSPRWSYLIGFQRVLEGAHAELENYKKKKKNELKKQPKWLLHILI